MKDQVMQVHGNEEQEATPQISPEKLEEQKLMNKFPGGLKKAPSTFAQRRLQQGQRKFFDSGDYNMAKAKGQLKLNPLARPPSVTQPPSSATPPNSKPSPSSPPIPGGIAVADAGIAAAAGKGLIVDTSAESGSGGGVDAVPLTGNAIPTPETVPLRKSSIIHPSAHDKLSPQPLITHHPPLTESPNEAREASMTNSKE